MSKRIGEKEKQSFKLVSTLANCWNYLGPVIVMIAWRLIVTWENLPYKVIVSNNIAMILFVGAPLIIATVTLFVMNLLIIANTIQVSGS
jgi:hypothetical protein